MYNIAKLVGGGYILLFDHVLAVATSSWLRNNRTTLNNLS